MTRSAPRGAFPRLVASWWRQSARQQPAPQGRADGRRVLVTGGNGGIGLATAKELLERGADVVIACRDPERARRACEQLGRAVPESSSSFVVCDLADLRSVAACVERVGAIDGLVCNAGISPTRYSTTQQGHESAFGVNVLGHVALVQGLLDHGSLTAGGKVVWITGDIYVLASDCTPDFHFSGAWGGVLSYARSKLGGLWMRHAFAEERPDVQWYAVHPGIAATHLILDIELSTLARRVLGMIDAREAARTTIRCLVEDVAEGYHHNVLGEMTLADDDVGADRQRAWGLYAQCRAFSGI